MQWDCFGSSAPAWSPPAPETPGPGTTRPRQPWDLHIPRAGALGPAGPLRGLGRRSGDLRVSGRIQAEGREAGAGVECLYRDPRATRFSFASLSDLGKTPFDLLSDILALNS